MAGLKLFFNISYRQSSGAFQMSWGGPTIACWDDHAILNMEGNAYNVTMIWAIVVSNGTTKKKHFFN